MSYSNTWHGSMSILLTPYFEKKEEPPQDGGRGKSEITRRGLDANLRCRLLLPAGPDQRKDTPAPNTTSQQHQIAGSSAF
jgi:hypothetical protein